MALNLASGEALHDFRDHHAGADVLAFYKQVDKTVPRELDLHVVLDNLSAHKAPKVQAWLTKPRQQRWHLQLTSTSSSWLGLVEHWFRELTERRLRRGSFCSIDHLTSAITIWAEAWNEHPRPFIWRAPAEDILAKLRRGRDQLNNHTNSTLDH